MKSMQKLKLISDDLKLCLKKVKSATSAEDGSEPKVNLPGNHEKGGAKNRANLLMDVGLRHGFDFASSPSLTPRKNALKSTLKVF